jgi:predicted HD phosphohydrolase
MNTAFKYLMLTAQETYGEAVTHLDHAIQTYALLLPYHDKELAVAGFWHDIGHSLPHTERMGQYGARHHERHGAHLFRHVFPKKVCQLIALHTAAKRYKAHAQDLSLASRHTLFEQGGPMTAEERCEFESHPYFNEALLLRQADDNAKDPAFRGDRTMLLLQALTDSLDLRAHFQGNRDT